MKRMNKTLNGHGFTAVELVVTTALVSLLSLAILAITSNMLSTQKTVTTRSVQTQVGAIYQTALNSKLSLSETYLQNIATLSGCFQTTLKNTPNPGACTYDDKPIKLVLVSGPLNATQALSDSDPSKSFYVDDGGMSCTRDVSHAKTCRWLATVTAKPNCEHDGSNNCTKFPKFFDFTASITELPDFLPVSSDGVQGASLASSSAVAQKINKSVGVMDLNGVPAPAPTCAPGKYLAGVSAEGVMDCRDFAQKTWCYYCCYYWAQYTNTYYESGVTGAGKYEKGTTPPTTADCPPFIRYGINWVKMYYHPVCDTDPALVQARSGPLSEWAAPGNGGLLTPPP